MDKIIPMLKGIATQTTTLNEMEAFLQDKFYADKLFQLVKRHKIEFLLFALLQEQNMKPLFDEPIIDIYIDAMRTLQVKYKEYLISLAPVFNSFKNENVKYAVLKGFSFMDELYTSGDGITRRFADIDILIDRSDASKAKRILEAFDFIQGKVIDGNIVKAKRKDLLYWEINSHQLHEYVKQSSFSEYNSKYWIEVDINTTIFEGGTVTPPIETKALLCQTIPKITNEGTEFRILNDTYSLIQLCYHFYKDTIYESKKETNDNLCLIKFCDIHRFILKKSDSINWDELVEVVNRAKINNQIYYPLRLVSSFFQDLDIDPILKKIKGTNANSMSKLDWEKLLL